MHKVAAYFTTKKTEYDGKQSFASNFYYWKLIYAESAGMSKDCTSNTQKWNGIKKVVKKGHDAFPVIRK